METVINNIYICERNADFVLKSVTINMTLISLIHCIDCVLILSELPPALPAISLHWKSF